MVAAISLSPLMVPAFVLVALTAAAVGMSIAHLSPSPVLTRVTTNVIIFSLFLFSPVNFPIERLPAGLSHVHRGLPVWSIDQPVHDVSPPETAGLGIVSPTVI